MTSISSVEAQRVSVSKKGLVLLMVCLGHYVVDFSFGIWPAFKTLRELDLVKAGLIAGIAGALGEGMQLVFGGLSDRGWRKYLLMFGAIASASNSLLGYFNSYEAYLFLFILTCMGSGAFHPTAAGLLAQTTQHRKGLYMGLFGAVGTLGMATSQLVFSKMYLWAEGKTVFLIIPSLVVTYLIYFFSIGDSPQGKVRSDRKSIFLLKEFFVFFRNKDLRHLYFSQLCNQFFFWGFIFLLPDLLASRGSSPWVCLGGGHFCLILGAAAALIPAGWIADKITARRVIFIASVAAVVLLYALLLFSSLSNEILLLLLFFFGSALGSINPLSVALGNQYMPDKPGTISAFLMGFVWVVSELFGAPISGFLTSFFVEDAPAKALACTGSALVVAIYHAWHLPIASSDASMVQEGSTKTSCNI